MAYARSISTQFEFIVRAWIRNPNFPHPGAGVDRLLAFDTHDLAGSCYFVPVRRKGHPSSWILPPMAG